ncbi:hypothetical protein RUMHYD_02213, partial [Blautia hydrogenotrophica DSM 10507]
GLRSINVKFRCASRALIFFMTAVGEIKSKSAAFVKLPQSAAQTKTLSCGLNIGSSLSVENKFV